MIKPFLSALGAAAFVTTTPLMAQNAQERLDSKYDRALAAGYKALMLCSAIGNAEKNGASRTPESVHAWELTGIQAPLNAIVQDLEYEIVRRQSGQIAHVAVDWAQDMPPRVAAYFAESGCSALPIGTPEDWSESERAIAVEDSAPEETKVIAAFDLEVNETENFVSKLSRPFGSVFAGAMDEKYGKGTRTTAVLVREIENGSLKSESASFRKGFDENTPQRTWSVAKSIAATLVGAAVQSGDADVSAPVGMNYWRQGGGAEPRNAITLDHMLRMSSGRYSDTPGNRTDPLYWGGATVNEHATGWPLIHQPGTVYRYANNDTLMAVKAINQFLGFYPPSEFFEKLGMNNTVAETDIRGDYILSSQVWSTADDLAKLGQLYLNDGVINKGQVNEERMLPENWREYVSDPSGPQPEGRQWGYGAGWWTFRRPEGNAFEGIPDDAFAARGNRGQYLVVVPSRNIVIVRRGEDPVGSRFDIIAFTRDILAALEQ